MGNRIFLGAGIALMGMQGLPVASASASICSGQSLRAGQPSDCIFNRMSPSLGSSTTGSAPSPNLPVEARRDRLNHPNAPDAYPFANTDLDVRVSASAWSGDRQLSNDRNIFYPQVLAKLTHKVPEAGVSFVAEGYTGYERGISLDHERGRATLREAYVNVKQGPVVARLGSQIISWGRADVVNPTDNVSAYDYTLLAPSDSEQKLGVPSASVTYRLGPAAIQAIWQPFFRGSQLPLPQMNGFRYKDQKPKNTQNSGGVRIDVAGDALGWSISYFQGPSKRQNLALNPVQIAQGVLDTNHPNVATYGTDFEYLNGKWVFRGEGAYNRLDGSGSDPLSSRESFALGVLGIERSFGETSSFFQITYRRTLDFLAPYKVEESSRDLALANAAVNEELKKSQVGLGGGITYSGSNLRWFFSADAAYLPANKEFALRPRVKFSLNDHVFCWAGGDYFQGSRLNQFGRLKDNTAIFSGITGSI